MPLRSFTPNTVEMSELSRRTITFSIHVRMLFAMFFKRQANEVSHSIVESIFVLVVDLPTDGYGSAIVFPLIAVKQFSAAASKVFPMVSFAGVGVPIVFVSVEVDGLDSNSGFGFPCHDDRVSQARKPSNRFHCPAT